MEGETLAIIQAPTTPYTQKKKRNAFTPVTKAKVFGNKGTSKLACAFQQGMKIISSMLPQSFYGVEKGTGPISEASSLFVFPLALHTGSAS